MLGLGTGQRNVAAALVVATQNFADPGVVVMLLVSTLAGLVPLLTREGRPFHPFEVWSEIARVLVRRGA